MSSELEGTVAALLERHWEPTFRLAHAVLRDPGAAEDAAQLAFLRVVEVLREGRPVEKPGPFLRSVVMNEARQSLRGAKRRLAHEERAATSKQEAAPTDPARAVREIIEGLPEVLRLPLELHYALGLTHAEVGELLECPRGTVTSRIQDGLEKLRGSLALAGIVLAIAAIEGLLAAPAYALEAPPAPSAKTLLRRTRAPSKAPVRVPRFAVVTAVVGLTAILAGTVFLAPDSAPKVANDGHPAGHGDDNAAVASSDAASVAPIDTTGGAAAAEPDARVAKGEPRAIKQRVLSRGSAGNALHVPNAGGFVITKDRTKLFAYSREELQVIDLVAKKPLFKIRCAGPDAPLIWSAVLSLDESRLFTWDRNRQLCVWDASTGALLAKHVHEKIEGLAMVLAPDGRSLVIGKSFRGRAAILSPDGATVLREVGPEVEAYGALAFSPDGKLLAVHDGLRRVHVLDASDGHEVRRIEALENGERHLVFSPDGSRLYGANRRTIKVWATATGDELHEIKADGELDCLEFSPDGATLLAGLHDGRLLVVATATGRIERTIVASRRNIVGLAFLPGGEKVVLSSLDDTVRILDLATGKTDTALEGHSTVVYRAVLSLDGRRALTASDDHSICVWDVASGRLVKVIEREAPSVLAFAPDGRTFVVDGLPHLPYLKRGEVEPFFARLDAVTGEVLATSGRPYEDGHLCGALAVVSADASRAALASNPKSAIVFFEGDAMRPVGVPVPANLEERVKLALTAAGDALAIATEAEPGAIRIHSVETGELVRSISSDAKPIVSSLAFSQDGRLLVVTEGAATVRLYSPSTGELLRTVEGLAKAVLSPRGDLLAGLSGDVLRVVNAGTGETFAETKVAESLTALGFGSDGRTIVAGDAQGGVSVFELPAR